MSNSEKFIAAYNRIDSHLKSIKDSHMNFTDKVKIHAEKNVLIRRHKDYLLVFAKLRNAIVHNTIEPNFIIAEPHDSIVEKIESIEKDILSPKLVFPHFNTAVTTFKDTDMLSSMLITIREKAFSQFPIYRENIFKGLVTENGITNWLVRNVENDLISIEDTIISDILPLEEESNNYKFISRKTKLYEADEAFKESTRRGIKLDALLITENGIPTETLIGIITTWDIIDIFGDKVEFAFQGK